MQVNIIPVNNEYHLEWCKGLYKDMDNMDIRVNLDDRDEKLSYKMREKTSIKKVPYTLIIGDKEIEDNVISYRRHGEVTDTSSMNRDLFIKMIGDSIRDRKVIY